jgi:hypothetical protein
MFVLNTTPCALLGVEHIHLPTPFDLGLSLREGKDEAEAVRNVPIYTVQQFTQKGELRFGQRDRTTAGTGGMLRM